MGFEPTNPLGSRILSPLRKPFRHPGLLIVIRRERELNPSKRFCLPTGDVPKGHRPFLLIRPGPDSNRRIAVLQTAALPLRHLAVAKPLFQHLFLLMTFQKPFSPHRLASGIILLSPLSRLEIIHMIHMWFCLRYAGCRVATQTAPWPPGPHASSSNYTFILFFSLFCFDFFFGKLSFGLGSFFLLRLFWSRGGRPLVFQSLNR